MKRGLNMPDIDNICCEETKIHAGAIDTVRCRLPDESALFDLADFFKVFGDSTRIRILYALYESELCVCDLSELLSVSQSAVSHQLALLRANKLVKYRRDGKTVYYSLDDDHIFSIIAQGMEHIKEG
jgi:DNA-binding transcriptional ArsR family regulator